MSQNRYYWGVILATLSEWSGHEPEEFHDFFKESWLHPVTRELPNGNEMTAIPTTTALTVEQFSEYVDRVVRWAAEQGVHVPDANEVTDV